MTAQVNLLTSNGLLLRAVKNQLLAEFHALGRSGFLFCFNISCFHCWNRANCECQAVTAWALFAHMVELREGTLGGTGPMNESFMLQSACSLSGNPE